MIVKKGLNLIGEDKRKQQNKLKLLGKKKQRDIICTKKVTA